VFLHARTIIANMELSVALSMGKHWNKATQMIFLKLFPLAAVDLVNPSFRRF
jgi:hypothetical protein